MRQFFVYVYESVIRMKEKQANLGIILMFLVYEIIQAGCTFFSGDDFWWYAEPQNIPDLFGRCDQNGRYLTNILTFLMIHHTTFRIIFHIAVMLGLFVEIAFISNYGKKPENWWNWLFSASMLIFVPLPIYKYTIVWISGFANYVFSAVLILGYLLFCMPFFQNEEKSFKKRHIGLLILGICSALCIENVTVYIIMLSVGMIIFSLIQFKKVHAGHILYLIGAIAGTALMFLDKNYHTIIEENNDSVGIRFVDFSFVEIMMKIYDKIITYYAKPFWIVHICIAVSLLILYHHKKTTKYSRICMGIVLIFACYSAFTQNVIDFEVISTKYTIRAIETAFAFLYILSVIYLSYILTERKYFRLICLFLFSTMALMAPFLVVNPVTERCFFSEYIFWVLTGAVLLMVALPECGVILSIVKKCLQISVFVFSFILSVMQISNKYCDIVRIQYLKKQLEEETNSIMLIELPYPDLVKDYIHILEEKSVPSENPLRDKYYIDILIQTYELNPDVKNKTKIFIDWYHYHLDSSVNQ